MRPLNLNYIFRFQTRLQQNFKIWSSEATILEFFNSGFVAHDFHMSQWIAVQQIIGLAFGNLLISRL